MAAQEKANEMGDNPTNCNATCIGEHGRSTEGLSKELISSEREGGLCIQIEGIGLLAALTIGCRRAGLRGEVRTGEGWGSSSRGSSAHIVTATHTGLIGWHVGHGIVRRIRSRRVSSCLLLRIHWILLLLLLRWVYWARLLSLLRVIARWLLLLLLRRVALGRRYIPVLLRHACTSGQL